jgi:hypothetical protein
MSPVCGYCVKERKVRPFLCAGDFVDWNYFGVFWKAIVEFGHSVAVTDEIDIRLVNSAKKSIEVMFRVFECPRNMRANKIECGKTFDQSQIL